MLLAALVHSRSGSTATLPTTDGRARRSNVATAASARPAYDSTTAPPMTYSTRSSSSNGSPRRLAGPSSSTWKKHSPIRSPTLETVTSTVSCARPSNVPCVVISLADAAFRTLAGASMSNADACQSPWASSFM